MQHGIISESFEELISKMNEFEKSNEVFASQVYPVNTDKLRWYGIIFHKSTKVVPTPLKTQSRTSDEPTDKQVKYLKSMNVKVPNTKTEATKIIGEYIENQKKENIW